MKFLISESHYRSRVWLKALSELCKSVTLISILKTERRFYKKNNLLFDKIIMLDIITKKNKLLHFNIAIDIVEKFENLTGKYILELVKSDRRLKRFKEETIIQYSATIIKAFTSLIKKNKFKFCFMELTWHHEIILYEICNIYNIKVLKPVRCKITPNHFYLFEKSNNEKFWHPNLSKNKIVKTNLLQDTEKIEKEYLKTKELYEIKILNSRNNINFKKFITLTLLIHRRLFGGFYYYIHQSLFWYIKYKLKCIFRKFYLNSFYSFDFFNKANLDYVYLPLHVQPEAAIDVLGREYSDQFNFVKKCSESLPLNFILVVKDHPHDFGRKKAKFYDKIKKIPNCILINPKVDSHNLIKHSSLVITVAGTASLEASLMMVPAITAIKMYYSKLLVRESFNPNIDSINDILNDAKLKWKIYRNSNEYKKNFMNILNHRFVGSVGAIDIDKNVINNKNLDRIRKMFNDIVNKFD